MTMGVVLKAERVGDFGSVRIRRPFLRWAVCVAFSSTSSEECGTWRFVGNGQKKGERRNGSSLPWRA